MTLSPMRWPDLKNVDAVAIENSKANDRATEQQDQHLRVSRSSPDD